MLSAVRSLLNLLSLIGLFIASAFYIRYQNASPVLAYLLRMVAVASVPIIFIISVINSLISFRRRRLIPFFISATNLWMSALYIFKTTRPHSAFEPIFGQEWEKHIPADVSARMLSRRYWSPLQRQSVRFDQNIIFWTVPETGRDLLCDIWQPPVGVKPSGLAYIYLHGSGWHFQDKDQGTRNIFRQLASQGHVVMDVAYRLVPEAYLEDMIADARRAVIWMHQNAEKYHVNPDKIVLAGASAGGHIALMSAYIDDNVLDLPEDVQHQTRDLCAVVSFYAPAQLTLLYEYGHRILGIDDEGNAQMTVFDRISNTILREGSELLNPPVPDRDGEPVVITNALDMLTNFMGCLPVDDPERYLAASPVTYVNEKSPMTLILQGSEDSQVPAEQSRILYDTLTNAGVPAIYIEYPAADHGFDLALPWISPAPQGALYDLERFLALVAFDAPLNGQRVNT